MQKSAKKKKSWQWNYGVFEKGKVGSHYGNVMGNQVQVKGSLSGSCVSPAMGGVFGVEGSPSALCTQEGEVPSFQMEQEEGTSRV